MKKTKIIGSQLKQKQKVKFSDNYLVLPSDFYILFTEWLDNEN